MLSAFEQPQRTERGQRSRERVFAELTAPQSGLEVLRDFVADAGLRAQGRPKIAVVTASALDPMEPVDFYLALFEALGAEAQWWPLDAALAAAIESQADCSALEALRLRHLQLMRRAEVYPDLAAQQAAACRQPAALTELPAAVHGVFFAGGDQWRLRQAFFDDTDTPLPWLTALRQRYESGQLVVGGTSAGAAVQSQAAMLSNGSPLSALQHPGLAGAPPSPGCGRDGRCGTGIDEERLSFWPSGGLGLATAAVVDTHFSERSREPRLLRLLAQTGAAFGFGADEASALHLQTTADGSTQVRGIGASGGWVFVRPETDDPRLQAEVYYLAPGARLALQGEGLQGPLLADCLQSSTAAAAGDVEEADALQPGALRAAARALARCGEARRSLRTPAGPLQLVRQPETRVVPGPSGPSIGPLRMSASAISDER